MIIINNKKGFTLIEMLMAVAIFAVASVIIMSTFVNAINLEQQTANYQKLQNDGRYIVEKIAKEVRGREIIPIYPGQNPTSSINFFPDEYDSIVSIYYDPNTKNLIYSQDGFADSLNSPNVEIEELKFFILPSKDPFSNVPISNVQPRATIYMKLKNKPAGKYAKELIIQTTISSKFYKR
ncbi:MAG: type II secretion system protein [Candidatus Buchananbacteria bacterium]